LARGWNTWDNHNLLSHVLLPEGLSISIGFDRGEVFNNSYLNRTLVGQSDVKVMPGPHLCDGSDTSNVKSAWSSTGANEIAIFHHESLK
jgi:hypothetical protein